jgi:hypothetical protein
VQSHTSSHLQTPSTFLKNPTTTTFPPRQLLWDPASILIFAPSPRPARELAAAEQVRPPFDTLRR